MLEVKIVDARFLAAVLDQLADGIKLEIPIGAITSNMVASLESAAKNYQGKCPVQIVIHNIKEKQSLFLRPRKIRVAPSEFLKSIREIEHISLSLTRKLF
jgi:hypothetical protein